MHGSISTTSTHPQGTISTSTTQTGTTVIIRMKLFPFILILNVLKQILLCMELFPLLLLRQELSQIYFCMELFQLSTVEPLPFEATEIRLD